MILSCTLKRLLIMNINLSCLINKEGIKIKKATKRKIALDFPTIKNAELVFWTELTMRDKLICDFNLHRLNNRHLDSYNDKSKWRTARAIIQVNCIAYTDKPTSIGIDGSIFINKCKTHYQHGFVQASLVRYGENADKLSKYNFMRIYGHFHPFSEIESSDRLYLRIANERIK